MSNVDNSVSVEPAECAWFGVDGKLLLINRFHVFFRSVQIQIEIEMEIQMKINELSCRHHFHFGLIHLMAVRSPATHSTILHSSAFPRPSSVFVAPAVSQSKCMSIALRRAECRSIQSSRPTCTPDREFDKFHQRELKHDPSKIKRNSIQCRSHWKARNSFTLEYIKLNGKLIAIDSSHTKNIFNTTRRRVLFRPKRIGYRRDK